MSNFQMRGNIIYVGTSGSGKTMHMLKYVKSNYKRCRKYVLNDTSNLAKKFKSFEAVDWDFEFAKIRNSVLICEDLICLSSKQLLLLATFVNVLRRHQDNTCVLITHALRGNNLYSLVQHMNFFVFLSGRANISNFNVVCTIFKIPEDIQARGQDFFLHPPGKYYSLILNTETFELTITDPYYNKVSGPNNKEVNMSSSVQKSQMLDQIQNVLKPFPNGAQLFAFASFLVNNLPPQYINPDLSVKGIGKNRKSVRVSLIDYINVVSSESSPMSKAMLGLHSFLLSKLTIPHLFIKNKHLI
jgi:GTPase SAR1 family protein